MLYGDTKNVFHRLWVTHSLFVGKNFYKKSAILFLGGIQKWIK